MKITLVQQKQKHIAFFPYFFPKGSFQEVKGLFIGNMAMYGNRAVSEKDFSYAVVQSNGVTIPLVFMDDKENNFTSILDTVGEKHMVSSGVVSSVLLWIVTLNQYLSYYKANKNDLSSLLTLRITNYSNVLVELFGTDNQSHTLRSVPEFTAFAEIKTDRDIVNLFNGFSNPYLVNEVKDNLTR